MNLNSMKYNDYSCPLNEALPYPRLNSRFTPSARNCLRQEKSLMSGQGITTIVFHDRGNTSIGTAHLLFATWLVFLYYSGDYIKCTTPIKSCLKSWGRL